MNIRFLCFDQFFMLFFFAACLFARVHVCELAGSGCQLGWNLLFILSACLCLFWCVSVSQIFAKFEFVLCVSLPTHATNSSSLLEWKVFYASCIILAMKKKQNSEFSNRGEFFHFIWIRISAFLLFAHFRFASLELSPRHCRLSSPSTGLRFS